ncbi:hypothetical protein SAMN05444410_11248 [Hydrobacter penzbergensis]|uniref:Uncharacterized protein n=1 Tax=Hydrobacter penzbergensis TaxID=1235997 RepID=A0A8X8LC54_9BACT|nr:hypothetical protein [Hydrobacter penzbergensis]SDX27200.1 hypothetical protein SAMN05444410_11248 [Hydrobacter penzbergensis]
MLGATDTINYLIMGLLVESLNELPTAAQRGYYLYLLDYGWHEPISDALRENFARMAQRASGNNAVIIRGTLVGFHFENEVMSWRHINNEKTDELLPALLITNAHPAYFRDRFLPERQNEFNDRDFKMILIPFKKCCKNTTEVIDTIEKYLLTLKIRRTWEILKSHEL